MNYKILIPLFVFSAIIYSCKKDAGSPNSTTPDNSVVSSYLPGNVLLVDHIAIYTSTGIVTDPSAIQTYMNQHLSPLDAQKFYVGKTYVPNPFLSLTLDILTGSRVQLNGKIMEITGINDSLMLVSEYDSTEIPYVAPNNCDQLRALVPSITPDGNCATGNCTKYRKTYPIRIYGNAYYLPFLYFAVSNSEPGLECSSTAAEFPSQNLLNQDLPSSLGPNDSVLVQICRLPMTTIRSK